MDPSFPRYAIKSMIIVLVKESRTTDRMRRLKQNINVDHNKLRADIYKILIHFIREGWFLFDYQVYWMIFKSKRKKKLVEEDLLFGGTIRS